MAAWIQVSTKLCNAITTKLDIVRPAHNKPMLLPNERAMISEDVRIHRESATVNYAEEAVKALLKIVAMDESVEVRAAISPHGAEMNKLTFVFPNLNNCARYTGMDDTLKNKILIRDAVIQERDCLVVSGSIVRELDCISADGLLVARSWNGDSPLSDSDSKKDDKRLLSIGVSNSHYRLCSVPHSRHHLNKLNIYHPDVIWNTLTVVWTRHDG